MNDDEFNNLINEFRAYIWIISLPNKLKRNCEKDAL